MISTEINILDVIQLSEQDIDIITLAAKNDAIIKITNLLRRDGDVDEYETNFNFELICRVKITPKNEK